MKLLRRVVLATALALWLTGCGPGVGGTGTGESAEYLALFGATAQPLCAAPFATGLACTPPSSPDQPAPSAGTVAVAFVDVASGGRVSVRFERNSVEIEAPCQSLQFMGDWGTNAAGDARFYGSVLSAAAPGREPARLSVSAAPDAAGQLELLLQSADGRVLLGPLNVRPGAAPSPPPCN